MAHHTIKWNGATVDAAHGGLGFDTFSVGDIFVADSAHTLRLQHIDLVNKVLTSNGTTVAYAYVDVLRDPTTGVAFTQIKVNGTSGLNKLAAVNATEATDDRLAYVTLGYFTDAANANERIIKQEDFAGAVSTGTFTVTLAKKPLNLDMTTVQVFINGLKTESAMLALGTNNKDVIINTTTGTANLGFELDASDVVQVVYTYNPGQNA